MKDKDDPSEPLQTEFEAIAAPAIKRVSVTLDMDSDLLAWLKAQPTEWQREINNTMRFFMETSSPLPASKPAPSKDGGTGGAPRKPAPPARTPAR